MLGVEVLEETRKKLVDLSFPEMAEKLFGNMESFAEFKEASLENDKLSVLIGTGFQFLSDKEAILNGIRFVGNDWKKAEESKKPEKEKRFSPGISAKEYIGEPSQEEINKEVDGFVNKFQKELSETHQELLGFVGEDKIEIFNKRLKKLSHLQGNIMSLIVLKALAQALDEKFQQVANASKMPTDQLMDIAKNFKMPE